MGKIPDRWLDYKRVFQPIEGVPIIAFKTPLSKLYHRSAESDPDQEFTPQQLCDRLAEDGYKLAVVIDLTNTFKYYNGIKDFYEFGVQYEKVRCEGHVIPNDAVLMRVSEIISDVIYQHGFDSRKLVGIHCTHGVNRTGYIVARYLIDSLGYLPTKAIQAFNDSRGHMIERENYIDDLLKREPQLFYESWAKSRFNAHNCHLLYRENDLNNDLDDFSDIPNTFRR